MTHWDVRFLLLAQTFSGWSKDPGTRVGAVIVRPDRTIASQGYNGLPRGVADHSTRLLDRDWKLAATVHAEANAIVCAHEPLAGYSIYVWPCPPCAQCAALIIQSGIKRVVARTAPPEMAERWRASLEIAATMFSEAGVKLEVMSDA